jgi:Meiotically up-regulated gene 113
VLIDRAGVANSGGESGKFENSQMISRPESHSKEPDRTFGFGQIYRNVNSLAKAKVANLLPRTQLNANAFSGQAANVKPCGIFRFRIYCEKEKPAMHIELTRHRYIQRLGDYHYFRFPGHRRVRLQGVPGSDEYFAHYAELMQRAGKPLPQKLPTQPRSGAKRNLPLNIAAARYVYLIERGDGGIVKVGIAKNVRKRRSQLANASAEKLSILRILTPNNCWPVHIESAFKTLMQPCHLRGEWFKCTDILAIVALHVVEHGDLAGCALVRAVLIEPFLNHEALHIYAADLARRFPAYFERLKPVAGLQNAQTKGRRRLLNALEYNQQDRQRVSKTISIYPDEWNKARLARNRARREAAIQAFATPPQ